MLSMEHILNKQGITQSLRKQIASMLSATAPNRGKCCRCGKGAEWQCRPEGLQRGRSGKSIPQRHRIAEFAAVVAKGQSDNAVQKACRKGTAEKDFPQRHRIAGNAAVVAKGQRDNAVQKAYREGAAEKAFRNGTGLRNLLPLWQKGRQPTRQATKQANQADKKRRNKPKQAK